MVYTVNNNFIPFKSQNKLMKVKNVTNQKGILRPMAVLGLAIIIFGFNSLTGISLSAQTSESSIDPVNLLREHNVIRANLGLEPLKINLNLDNSALAKANAMLSSDCWSHYCPDGKSPWTFFQEAGYNYVLAGENLAEGFFDVNAVMNAWLNSPTHKANIVKPEYQEIGFGIVSGTFQGISNNIIIAVHFGTRADQIASTVAQRSVNITKPLTGTVTVTNQVLIEGKAHGASSVEILNNQSSVGKADILEGIFTYNLKDLSVGANIINAKATWAEGTVLLSDSVTVQFQPSGTSPGLSVIEPNLTGGVSGNTRLAINLEAKNAINLVFILIIAGIFFADFAILSKTRTLIPGRTFSHYHFVMALIVAGLIFLGGFAGRISEGIIR